MKIHELEIKGFKSIGEIKLVEPNPFSVFVGPNGAGKSNIFEGLEFMTLCNIMGPNQVLKLFGSPEDVINFLTYEKEVPKMEFRVDLGILIPSLKIDFAKSPGRFLGSTFVGFGHSSYQEHINFKNFTRLFAGEQKTKVKRNLQDDLSLASDASNLEKVLKRILKDEKSRDEIIEILQLLIPGFSSVEIRTEELSGSVNLIVYEDALKKPLTKRLISDGTYNILALITAIYQSEEPQFLCIEEPENGLNPKVVKQLVSLFRDKCKEKGHYIWLNTHSQTLVSELTPDEIILVDKVNGLTQAKQVKGFDLHGMKMDEALLTNALGGGIPW